MRRQPRVQHHQLVALPWQTDTGLLGPAVPDWALDSWASKRHRHQRWPIVGGVALPKAPTYVCAVYPSFKQVRGALAEWLCGVQAAGPLALNELLARFCASTTTLEDGALCLVVPWVGTASTGSATSTAPALPAWLATLGERLVRRIQALRAKSYGSGRWWPAPQALQLLVGPDGRLTARLAFAPHFCPPGKPWCMWP
ncbi:hypothetical protein [Rhodoferax bucti]|uniref:hypothetical protein n=1 Tax=Rhodoferax bucti TaxID=2576305 RepID=UPI0011093C34|nr:hypothetical protein [Rhodoferax bucti]